eukprot:5608667-Amphidinium_carterae.3
MKNKNYDTGGCTSYETRAAYHIPEPNAFSLQSRRLRRGRTHIICAGSLHHQGAFQRVLMTINDEVRYAANLQHSFAYSGILLATKGLSCHLWALANRIRFSREQSCRTESCISRPSGLSALITSRSKTRADLKRDSAKLCSTLPARAENKRLPTRVWVWHKSSAASVNTQHEDKNIHSKASLQAHCASDTMSTGLLEHKSRQAIVCTYFPRQ